MIIWLNGAPAAPRNELAHSLREAHPALLVARTEHLTALLTHTCPEWADLRPEDIPTWPALLAKYLEEVHYATDKATILLTDTVYSKAASSHITASLDTAGIHVEHLVLHIDTDVQHQRREALKEVIPEAALSRFHSNLTAYQDAYTTWMPRWAKVIDITRQTEAETLAAITEAVDITTGESPLTT